MHILAAGNGDGQVPHLFWVWPFAALLLCIALLPLIRRTHHWWESNRSKLLVSVVLALATLLYYGFRGYGIASHAEESHAPAAEAQMEPAPAGEIALPTTQSSDSRPAAGAADGGDEAVPTAHAEPAAEAHGPAAVQRTESGWSTVVAVLEHAVLAEYVPFLVLLFSLYVIAGGIVVRGDIQATPLANTTIIGIGGLLASFIGTTGASMVLIRLLLRTNQERTQVVHTVVFFIFVVSNIGGLLLPIGDPPLFLGYLRGVPFFWTLQLWPYWAFMTGLSLLVYWAWDTWAYRHERAASLSADRTHIEPLHIAGLLNFVWIFGVVLAVATLDPQKPFLWTSWHPWPFLREAVQLAMAGLSLLFTSRVLRRENHFNYVAIGEVACLFIGIFITMQVPIEILHAKGAELGLSRPWHFFWATGVLSSFLDNAPTYVVFFETAATLPADGSVLSLVGGGSLREGLLIAISCGAVFMGANSYIGNGPNFMVKTIAEQAGVRMPSFFGYMAYSAMILVPLFLVMTLVFFRG